MDIDDDEDKKVRFQTERDHLAEFDLSRRRAPKLDLGFARVPLWCMHTASKRHSLCFFRPYADHMPTTCETKTKIIGQDSVIDTHAALIFILP